MRHDLEKLSRLLEVHNQIVDWHLKNIVNLETDMMECDRQMSSTLNAMEMLEKLGIAKGPNFSRIFQEIGSRRKRLLQAVQKAKTEHSRMNSIVKLLSERKSGLSEQIDNMELEDSIDEWSNAAVSFS